MLLPFFSACGDNGAFTFYTRYAERWGTTTEFQKQEFRDGKYYLEVKTAFQHKDHTDASSFRISRFMIDADFMNAGHQVSGQNDGRGFTKTEPLYLTSAKTFVVEGKEREVFRFRTAGRIYNCCVDYDAYFWNPELGLITKGYFNEIPFTITDMAGIKRDYLYKPAHFSAREALKELIMRDKPFHYHPDSPQTEDYPFGDCSGHHIGADDCKRIRDLQQTIQAKLQYPDLPVPECYSGGHSVHGQLDKEGGVCIAHYSSFYPTIHEQPDLDEYFQKEVLLALAHLPKSMAPLTYEGIPLNAKIDLDLNFSIPDSNECGEVFRQREEEQKMKVYEIAEQKPVFPGGHEALGKFFKENMKYPGVADSSGKDKKVKVQFILNHSGEPEDISILHSFEDEQKELFEKEAIRLIKSMPKWSPAKQRGKTVRIRKQVVLDFSEKTGNVL